MRGPCLHIAHMDSWHTLDNRLKSGTAIDQVKQHLINDEILRWKEILHRLPAIVNHLAERNPAFRDHREKLNEHGNG